VNYPSATPFGVRARQADPSLLRARPAVTGNVPGGQSVAAVSEREAARMATLARLDLALIDAHGEAFAAQHGVALADLLGQAHS